jgi:hypothetical protein
MKRTIMQATVIRLDKNGILPSVKPNSFWLMNKQDTGWSSHGYPYPTLAMLLDEWDIELGAHGEDKHGLFIEAKLPMTAHERYLDLKVRRLELRPKKYEVQVVDGVVSTRSIDVEARPMNRTPCTCDLVFLGESQPHKSDCYKAP